MLNRHQIRRVDRSRRGKGQRRGLDGLVRGEWAPDVHDAVPSLRQGLGFGGIGDVEVYPGEGRLGRLVDVNAVHRLSRGIGIRAANGMIEQNDFVGVGEVLSEEGFNLGVVDLADGGVGVEGGVGGGGGHVLKSLEGILVQVEDMFIAADVGQKDALSVFAVIVTGLARRW